MPKFLRCGARFAGYELERYGISRQPQRLERGALERVEDGRLRLRGGGSAGHSVSGSGRLTLKNTCDMTPRRVLAASGGGSMLYGIISAFDMRRSHETVSVTLENNSNHSFVSARTPERPSSTR